MTDIKVKAHNAKCLKNGGKSLEHTISEPRLTKDKITQVSIANSSSSPGLDVVAGDLCAAVVDGLLPLEVHVVLAPVGDVRSRGRHRRTEGVLGRDGLQGLQVVRLPLGVDGPDPELVLVAGLEAVGVDAAGGRGAHRRPDPGVLGAYSNLL